MQRLAVVIGIEQTRDAGFPAVHYAEAGTKALAEVLRKSGTAAEHLHIITGSFATKSVIESRLRKLCSAARKGDSIVFAFSGLGFTHEEAGHLLCWDSLRDDLSATALNVNALHEMLTASRASQIIFMLDVGATPPQEDVLFQLSSAELTQLFADSPKAVCLMANDPDEESHQTPALGQSAWMHTLVDALAGRASKAVAKDGTLTVLALQKHLEAEMPRVLRKHFAGGTFQRPALYGEHNAGAVLADLSRMLGDDGGLLEPQRLARILFRSETSRRIRDLSGFRKQFQLPENAGPSTRKFIARCASADIRADVDEVFAAARDHLGYKRKDMESTTDLDGFATLRTPDFDYVVSMEIDTNDLSQVIWRREIGQISDIAFARSPGFQAVFGARFDSLVFEFAQPVDVVGFVDRLEESPQKGVRVLPESNGEACEVTLVGFAGQIRIERKALTIHGRSTNSAGLLDQFLAFLGIFRGLGDERALPAPKE